VIELEAVSVELGGARVVDGVSAGIEQGTWVTLLGPNGAGKSTLLRAIAGLVRAEGAIRIGGTPLRALDRRALARRVAVVPQLPQLPRALSVEEYVLLGRTPYLSYLGREGTGDHAAARSALERLDLVKMARRPLGSLSGGERQRAVLARALAQEARVLLLDEPTTALDPGRQQDVLELVDALRLLVGASYRVLLPLSILVCGAFLVLADIVARTALSPAELPIGVVTAFCGAPFFAVVLRTSRKVMG
jgi:iron complex transport system ATP-binding protein